jgi:hypothetical protein
VGALDVNSRFKLIAYSERRAGQMAVLYLLAEITWVKSSIVFTVDNGEEFGGKS